MEPVSAFLKLLSFPTVSLEGPKGSYQQCCDYLFSLCDQLQLNPKLHYPKENKPILIAEWTGSEPGKKIVLNSHYDVVPCELAKWNTDPFEPTVIDGKIFARGTQDMKCVCIQYLLAIQQLQAQGFTPQRSILLTFLPDEEIGGGDGMALLIKSGILNVDDILIALDEGLANPNNAYTIFYGERTVKWIIGNRNNSVRAEGEIGHGSQFIKKTAVEKLIKVLNEAMAFRKQQEEDLHYNGGCKHAQAKTLGDVTTVNCTYLKAGTSQGEGKYTLNVIPSEAVAGFDIRITPHMDIQEMNRIINNWCGEEGVSWEHVMFKETNEHQITQTQGNPFFEKLQEVKEFHFCL